MNRFARPPMTALLALGLLLATAASAQVRMTPPAPTYTLTAESGVPELPFRMVNNHLLIEASINGSEPLALILDTGMPQHGVMLYGRPKVEELGLSFDPAIQARARGAGGDGGSVSIRMARDGSVGFPGLTMDDMLVLVMPPMPGLGAYHDGVIGQSLFERFVVELDYEARLVRLHDPATFEASAEAASLPLTFPGPVPHTEVGLTLNDVPPFEAMVIIDLGASHAISLNSDWGEAIRPPAATLETILGHGLSGPLFGQVGRVTALELGGLRLENVVTSFPESRHQNPRRTKDLAGNLGNDVLRRFKTTFDYAGKRMLLEPNRDFDEPFVYDRSGLRLASGEELAVQAVVAGSPAETAGFELGDVVTHLGGKSVTGVDYGTVIEALRGQGTVELTVQRGDERLERTVELRTLI